MADRSLSFGYNATMSVGLDVLQNFLDSFFDQQDNAHIITLTDVLTYLTGSTASAVEGSLHLLISRPMLDFDISRRPREVAESKNVVLRIHNFDGWVFGPEKVEDDPIRGVGSLDPGSLYQRILDIGRFTAYIEWYLALTTNRSGEISPSFDDIREEDLFVYLVRPSPDEPGSSLRRSRTERLLKRLLVYILQTELVRDEILGGLSFDLGIDMPELHTAGNTSLLGFDTAVFDDRSHPLSLVDTDNATLCLFERQASGDQEVFVDGDGDSSRGDVRSVENTLTRGKSFDFRISVALLDAILATAIHQRFMRLSVTIPSPLDEGETEVLDEASGLYFSRFSGDLIRIRSDANDLRGDLSGRIAIIEPPNTLVSTVDFSTTGDGTLRDMLIEAQPGWTLEFQGESIAAYWRGIDFQIKPPTQMSPVEGGIRVTGEIVATYLSVDYDIGYLGTIHLEFDPFFQRFRTSTHVPFPDDAGPLLTGYMASISGVGLFLLWPFIHRRVKRTVEEEIESRLDSSLASPVRGIIPQIGERGLFRAFFDSLELDTNGAILSGQVEAGRIRIGPWSASSQVRHVWVHRSSEAGEGAEAIEIDGEGDAQAMFYVDRDIAGDLFFACRVENTDVTEAARIAWLGSEPYRFHFTDTRALYEEIPYNDTDQVSRGEREITSRFYPEPSEVDGAVIAIRLPWGTCSKLEIHESPTGENIYSSRLVSYEVPSRPFVQIVDDGPWQGRLTSYSTILRFDTSPPPGQRRRLHSPRGRDGRPSYSWRFSSGDELLLVVDDTTEASRASARGIVVTRSDDSWEQVRVTVDARRLVRSWSIHPHRFRLVVDLEVNDIFGRTATATRTFAGRVLG